MTDWTLTLKDSNYKFSGNNLLVNQYAKLGFLLSGLYLNLIKAIKPLRLMYLPVRSTKRIFVFAYREVNQLEDLEVFDCTLSLL